MFAECRDAARQILRVIPLAMRVLAQDLRRLNQGLSRGHFRLLSILAEHPRNLSELAERQSVSLPTMSNTITHLVERDWVRRVRDPNDRRVVTIELTETGRELFWAIAKVLEERLGKLLSTLPPEELTQLSEGLCVLHGCFERVTENACPRDGDGHLSDAR